MNSFLPRALLLSVPSLCMVAACGSTVTNVGHVDPGEDAGATTTVGTDGGVGDGSRADGADGAILPSGAKRIFVTAQTFQGNLLAGGGLAGADAVCSAAAKGASLGGNFIAWISTSSVDAIDRVSDVGPWHDLAGAVVFADKDNLTTSPVAALRLDENGTGLPSARIWTGTGYGGKYIADLGPGSKPCGDWTSATMAETAKIGQVGRRDGAAWTSYAGTTCDQQAHLICLEQ